MSNTQKIRFMHSPRSHNDNKVQKHLLTILKMDERRERASMNVKEDERLGLV